MAQKLTYSDKLKDSRWQKKRLELFEKAGWQCQADPCPCKGGNVQLQIHHLLYLRNTDPWDYEDWAYQVLCDGCHEHAQSDLESAHIRIAMNPAILRELAHSK